MLSMGSYTSAMTNTAPLVRAAQLSPSTRRWACIPGPVKLMSSAQFDESELGAVSRACTCSHSVLPDSASASRNEPKTCSWVGQPGGVFQRSSMLGSAEAEPADSSNAPKTATAAARQIRTEGCTQAGYSLAAPSAKPQRST